jgi:hypothetical protein
MPATSDSARASCTSAPTSPQTMRRNAEALRTIRGDSAFRTNHDTMRSSSQRRATRPCPWPTRSPSESQRVEMQGRARETPRLNRDGAQLSRRLEIGPRFAIAVRHRPRSLPTKPQASKQPRASRSSRAASSGRKNRLRESKRREPPVAQHAEDGSKPLFGKMATQPSAIHPQPMPRFATTRARVKVQCETTQRLLAALREIPARHAHTQAQNSSRAAQRSTSLITSRHAWSKNAPLGRRRTRAATRRCRKMGPRVPPPNELRALPKRSCAKRAPACAMRARP